MGFRRILILFFSTMTVSLVILLVLFNLVFKNIDLSFDTKTPESAPILEDEGPPAEFKAANTGSAVVRVPGSPAFVAPAIAPTTQVQTPPPQSAQEAVVESPSHAPPTLVQVEPPPPAAPALRRPMTPPPPPVTRTLEPPTRRLSRASARASPRLRQPRLRPRLRPRRCIRCMSTVMAQTLKPALPLKPSRAAASKPSPVCPADVTSSNWAPSPVARAQKPSPAKTARKSGQLRPNA